MTQKDAAAIVMPDGRADEASFQKLFGEQSIGVLCVRFGDDLFENARRLAAGQNYFRTYCRGAKTLTPATNLEYQGNCNWRFGEASKRLVCAPKLGRRLAGDQTSE
jgi:hypothetical protein